MSNNEFKATVRGRDIIFPAVDGLTDIELQAIVGQVEEKIKAVMAKTNLIDTSKTAIVAAFEFAVELYFLKQRSETNTEAESRKLDEMVARLQSTLEEK